MQGVTLLPADAVRTFTAPVRLRLPGDAPGETGPAVLLRADEPRTFEAPVDILPPGRDESSEFRARFIERPGEDLLRLTARRGDMTRKALADILAGWDGICDAQGAPLPFSAETLDLLHQRPYLRHGITRAYLREIKGEGEAGREFRCTFREQPADILTDLARVRDHLPRKLLAAILEGWEDLEDSAGQAVAFDDTAIARVLQRPYVRNAIVNTYLRQISGERDLGNSVIAPAAGGAGVL